jgi:hypothetical protein
MPNRKAAAPLARDARRRDRAEGLKFMPLVTVVQTGAKINVPE